MQTWNRQQTDGLRFQNAMQLYDAQLGSEQRSHKHNGTDDVIRMNGEVLEPYFGCFCG